MEDTALVEKTSEEITLEDTPQVKKAPRKMTVAEKALVDQALLAIRETKGEGVMLFDMENRSPITDYVLICSGRSQAHVRGIVTRIEEELKKLEQRPSALEGYQEGSWALMDFGVLLVHVFHPETRAYYDLESLLADYPCQKFSESDADEAAETPTSS